MPIIFNDAARDGRSTLGLIFAEYDSSGAPTPRMVATWGSLTIVSLVLASIVVTILHKVVGGSTADILYKIFSVDKERNVPTLFSFFLIFFGAALCAIAAWRHFSGRGKWWLHWAALSAILVYLSYDEAAMVHERMVRPVRELTGASGAFHFAWVIPALIACAIVGLIYLTFVMAQPRGVRGLVIASGAVYLGGALGMEMIGAALFVPGTGFDSVPMVITHTIEEALEMTGMLLFCTAVLTLLTGKTDAIRRYNHGA